MITGTEKSSDLCKVKSLNDDGPGKTFIGEVRQLEKTQGRTLL